MVHGWIKSKSSLFGITMGAHDGAETCEPIRTYLLNILSNKYSKNNIGLYRDDGLAVFEQKSGPELERIKKNVQKILKDCGLCARIQCNLKIFDYLDCTFNLNNRTYQPYRKPNDETTFIYIESNHPPSIIKQVPIALEKHLSQLSSNENIFNQTAPYYEQVLQKSGYMNKLTYNKDQTNTGWPAVLEILEFLELFLNFFGS